ncbi:MAG: lysophospholipid acyltransferase family protein [bacterium]
MKVLVSIWLWCIGLLYFGFFLVVGLMCTYLFSPATYDPWIKAMMRFLFTLLRSPVVLEGDTNFDSGATYLFMSNHVSLFDLPLLAGYIPVFFRGIEASYQFDWPVYGWFVRRYGNIGIERESIHSSITSIRQAERMLKSGVSLTILPEGYRSLDGQLRPFKKLPFHLAQKAGVPIVPIGLSGMTSLKRKGHWLIRPTRVKIKFGEIIPAEMVHSLSNEELRDLTRERIQDLIERA